jgi:type I restriction enzyme S subunit
VNLKGLPILCPPLELQAAFSKKMREVEVYRLSLVRSEMAVKFLFASLQHRAFNGELTAKVAERELAEVG